MCLVYVANVLHRFQPHRACKQKPHPQHWQKLQITGDTRANVMEKPGLKAIEPEHKKDEVHEKTVKNSLDRKFLGNVTMNALYQDKPNILTDSCSSSLGVNGHAGSV